MIKDAFPIQTDLAYPDPSLIRGFHWKRMFLVKRDLALSTGICRKTDIEIIRCRHHGIQVENY